MCNKGAENTSYVLEESVVAANELLIPTVGVITLQAPLQVSRVMPGQFAHLYLPQTKESILRRPYSIFDVHPQDGTLEIMYQLVGKGSRYLSSLKEGDTCSLLGPIGKGWQEPAGCKRALFVCGGLGAAPLTMQMRKMVQDKGVEVDLVIGARDAQNLECHQRIMDLASHVYIATDDGSVGVHGFCTGLSQQLLEENSYDYACVCGPEPMMRIVAQQFIDAEIPSCQVSMERRMACGIGACLSCVVDTQAGKKRACVDGPVFDARVVSW